ncbi:MAG: serine hydrolase [Gammaproteobacteria bacterium]|nr:serine hydrolase [Gammaproteobacteria bacterium]MBV9696260.1 serine hydrolase [Gammaproteobacteria bacterium]
MAVAFRTLDGRSEWQRQAAQPFHAASTMKVPVLIELLHARQEKKLRLEDPLPLRNEFHSIVDGTPYALSPEDDSETDLYRHLGESRTLGTLAELMITVSSNLATNLLIERLGVENIRRTVHELGADGMSVLRGVEDNKAFEHGLNNTTSAAALCTLLTALAQGRVVDPAASAQMLKILERQQFNQGIPAGLPAGVVVAHKTGDITGVHHDAAVVFAARPYVLVILTRGLEEAPAHALMAQISHELMAASQP